MKLWIAGVKYGRSKLLWLNMEKITMVENVGTVHEIMDLWSKICKEQIKRAHFQTDWRQDEALQTTSMRAMELVNIDYLQSMASDRERGF